MLPLLPARAPRRVPHPQLQGAPRPCTGSMTEAQEDGPARTPTAEAWRWMRDEQAGRAVAVLLLLLLAVAVPALAFHGVVEAVLRVVLLALPSVLTLLAFLVLASMAWGRGRTAVLAGCGAYVLAGLLLAWMRVGYLENIRLDNLWVVLGWPTVTLLYLGPELGWWPDHAE